MKLNIHGFLYTQNMLSTVATVRLILLFVLVTLLQTICASPVPLPASGKAGSRTIDTLEKEEPANGVRQQLAGEAATPDTDPYGRVSWMKSRINRRRSHP